MMTSPSDAGRTMSEGVSPVRRPRRFDKVLPYHPRRTVRHLQSSGGGSRMAPTWTSRPSAIRRTCLNDRLHQAARSSSQANSFDSRFGAR